MKHKYVFFDDHHAAQPRGDEPHPPETREALRLLKANGHVATGRGPSLAPPIAGPWHRAACLRTGAHILNGGRTLHRTCLPAAASTASTSLAALRGEVAMDDCFIYYGQRKRGVADVL